MLWALITTRKPLGRQGESPTTLTTLSHTSQAIPPSLEKSSGQESSESLAEKKSKDDNLDTNQALDSCAKTVQTFFNLNSDERITCEEKEILYNSLRTQSEEFDCCLCKVSYLDNDTFQNHISSYKHRRKFGMMRWAIEPLKNLFFELTLHSPDSDLFIFKDSLSNVYIFERSKTDRNELFFRTREDIPTSLLDTSKSLSPSELLRNVHEKLFCNRKFSLLRKYRGIILESHGYKLKKEKPFNEPQNI